MAGTSALVVAEPSGTTQELDRALHADGFEVWHMTPAELTAGPDPDTRPDLLLVSASVGLRRLALLARRFAGGGRAPSIVVFPEGDFAALESCVRGGFDYVTPPFLPSLLRTRMASCWERGQLTTAVEEMATEASLREYERELHIAHEIQSGFLPEDLPTPEGWEVAARFRPAKEVGGDFYDVFELVDGRRLGFVVADVCDKGLGSALFMALIRTLLRHTAEHTGASELSDGEVTVTDTPAEHGRARPVLSVGAGPLIQAVVGTNRYMARNHLRQGYFATIFFGVLDPVSGALLYINGGHNPPVLVRADGEHTLLPPTGPAVGMLPNSNYTLGHTSIGPGDSLVVYTDGVVEARDPAGGMFGMDRLLQVVSEPGHTAEGLLDVVDGSVRHHVSAAEQFDDITMLALHRTAA